MQKYVRNLVFIGVCLASTIAHTADRPVKLPKDEAKELVKAALPSKTRHLPSFGLEEYSDSSRPRFYFYTAYWAGVPNGSVVIGNYAVDESTGDVWDAVISCKEESNPVLRKLQSEVRSKLGLSRFDYDRIKSKGPLC
jgi:hypothetical protein